MRLEASVPCGINPSVSGEVEGPRNLGAGLAPQMARDVLDFLDRVLPRPPPDPS